MNFKKKSFILTGGVLLIILAALFPLTISYVNSINNEMYFSYLKDIKNFSKDISNYTVGVEGSLYICIGGHLEGDPLEVVEYQYDYNLNLTPFSSEGINITGILFYTYECLLNGVSNCNYSSTLDRVSLIEEYGKIIVLSLGTRLTVRGSIEIEYTSNATLFTEVIDFSLNIVPPEARPEYNQTLSLALSLSYWHFASLIIVLVLLASLPAIIQRIKKQPPMTSEEKGFWRKVRERNKLLRKKNWEE